MKPDPNLEARKENTADLAINLLIDLAQQGEIDPWDVDVIKVVDRFFQEINALNPDRDQQTNLPQSGQAFLWASMLVSLKADTLEALAEEPEWESEETVSEEEEESQRRKLPQKLEHCIRRRGSAPPPKKRRVTLSELITQIQDLATEIESNGGKSSSNSSKKQGKRETARMISHLAHNENLTELATELEQFLMAQIKQVQPQNWLTLEELVQWWETEREGETSQSHRVGVFWALLLLSSQSKVELSQEAFYQDLNLRLLINED
ncbi:segregation/condensation protein A [Euhalothece natronophila Z-M001]|uniref:Segregation and condensation protein A n=1 Tax=Euhalothece natronophila Z-M001 TaxID=522448 RepID=A0A5B8NLB8_9CHRO|nr:segregation/condensation protein A [Euhalothece natronophila]QDZ40062.1 segregation/condensation protein A [Euhalothece natronophila Z-M001]